MITNDLINSVPLKQARIQVEEGEEHGGEAEGFAFILYAQERGLKWDKNRVYPAGRKLCRWF